LFVCFGVLLHHHMHSTKFTISPRGAKNLLSTRHPLQSMLGPLVSISVSPVVSWLFIHFVSLNSGQYSCWAVQPAPTCTSVTAWSLVAATTCGDFFWTV